jgi:hypothetical protein
MNSLKILASRITLCGTQLKRWPINLSRFSNRTRVFRDQWVTGDQRDDAMNGHAKAVTASVGRIGLRRWRNRMFKVAYSLAITVAMIGWSIGFGWAAIKLVKWLFA